MEKALWHTEPRSTYRLTFLQEFAARAETLHGNPDDLTSQQKLLSLPIKAVNQSTDSQSTQFGVDSLEKTEKNAMREIWTFRS